MSASRGALIDECVHCGFCLPACPTYRLWSHEADSPRGRIALMAAVEHGAAVGASVTRHMDRCLGCMGCVTACPSGVKYDRLIEGMRARVEAGGARGRGDRAFRAALFALLPHPTRLRWLRLALAAYRRSGARALVRSSRVGEWLPARLRALEQLQPEPRSSAAVPAVTPAAGEQRRDVVLLQGCVQSVFFSEVNAATARVLAAEGCRVSAPPAACCGALSLHAGRRDEARRLARDLGARLGRFQADAVVLNAAGCGSCVKSYADLADGDEELPRIARLARDVSELLAELPPRAQRHPLPLRVAYHEACHLSHAQQVRRAPRVLLDAIPELDVRVPRDLDQCCGSAGIYNLLEVEAAAQIGAAKAAAILDTDPQLVVTSNPGCALQIASHLARLGRPRPVRHVVELLDASIRGADAAELLS